MTPYSALTQTYINYINDLRQFSYMPLWKRELAGYNSRSPKPVTLPSVEREDGIKALNSILSLPISHSPDLD